MRIRVATPDDAAHVAALFVEFEHPTDAAALPGRIARFVADDRRTALVATLSGTVVGVATAHLYATLHADEPAVMLSALVVTNTVRGQGVGRALVDAVGTWAHERGARRLVVTTALRRADAHAFYERLGFEHTGRRYQRLLVS
jgi:GNAT superfamily N-acetyltransferase